MRGECPAASQYGDDSAGVKHQSLSGEASSLSASRDELCQALLPHKEALERHWVARLGELFELNFDLLLYDVTSTWVG